MVFVLPTLLFLSLFASYAPTLDHAGATHGRQGNVIAETTRSSLVKPNAAVCFGPGAHPSSNHTWLPLYHRRSPCSSLFHSETTEESMADVLRRDQVRAEAIISRKLSKQNGDVEVPTASGLPLGTLQYVVTVRLGTPAVTQTVQIDTGSSLSWVHCRPCPVQRCQPQKDALFDPANSSTYSPFTCRSPACVNLRARYGNGRCSSVCRYVVQYADGSNSTGTYGSDALALTSSHVVDKFQFGCSHAAPGVVGRADGLLALGGGAQSLVSQMGETAFSYCLPATPNDTGFLNLGMPRVAAHRYAVTPMYRSKQSPTFYLVRLQAIDVAGRRLSVPPSVFAAGAILDSGTIVTRLPPTAYRALRAAFRRKMRAYPSAPRNSILDTCYNLTGTSHDVKLPRVALVFERNATVELHPAGIMEQGCLAFAPTGEDDGDTGIIGNVQQRTFEVLYDVGGGAVGFRRGVC